jgi:hypothetical protein
MNTVRQVTESLRAQADDLHEEARMILPGVQALFGFQMVSVFNQRFNELDGSRQLAHLVAILMVVVAMGLLMTPAADHRLGQPDIVSNNFVRRSSKFIGASLVPLAIGLALDVYIVASLIAVASQYAQILGIAVFVGLCGLWIGVPSFVNNARQPRLK